MKTASSAPNFNYGFPSPGPQSPTGSKVMDHVFFVSETDWKHLREHEHFDYIIIGSGFCALGFAEEVYKLDPYARVLILERGPFFLPEHFQNLPLPFQQTLGGLSETFPWTLSLDMIEPKDPTRRFIRWQHGMVPFFGGRSTLWSGWCPRPTDEEFESWPTEVVRAAKTRFESAEKLLNVVHADRIDWEGKVPSSHRPIFGTLQRELTKAIQEQVEKVPALTRAIAAPLAVGVPFLTGVDFEKYSTPGPMLMLLDQQRRLAAQNKGNPLRIATNCTVNRIIQQNGHATALDTCRGIVNVGAAKLILAMGTLPPTTLVMNSFPQCQQAGERFTAHFITAIVARLPRCDFPFHDQLSDLELAAIYVAGVNRKTRGQFHIQLTALSDRHPEENARTALRHMPDVVATASLEQLEQSKDHIVFVCAVLGELDYKNPANKFRRTAEGDLTVNSMLHVEENDNDLAVWDTMDEATFATLENILSPAGPHRVEYWHSCSQGCGTFLRGRPAQSTIRVPALVHEGSTMWIAADQTGVVDLDYKLNGVDNVYITGASLWPTGASWNPTLTMVALAQDLATKLSNRKCVSTERITESLEKTQTTSAMS